MPGSDAWRRFRAAYWTELRLLCRHWAYVVLHLLWAGFLLWVTSLKPPGGAPSVLEMGLSLLNSRALLALAAIFVAAAGALRSQRSRFAHLEGALPTGPEVDLGRWLAGLTAVAAALITPLIIAAYQGSVMATLERLPVYLFESLMLLAVTGAATWWLASRLGMRRWLYPLLMIGWMLFLIGPRVRTRDGALFPGAQLLDLMRVAPDSYSHAWGRPAAGNLPLWFSLCQGGLLLIFLSLIVWHGQARRLQRRALLAGVLTTLALVLTAVSSIQFVSIHNARERMAVADDTYHRSLSLPTPAVQPEAADSYAVTADLSDPGQPRFTARIAVRNRGKSAVNRLSLTLNQHFNIVSVSLPYERTGDFLSLTPPAPVAPGGTVTVQVEYAGSITVFDRSFGSTVPVLFAQPEGVHLMPQAGWYPMAGRQVLGPHGPGIAQPTPFAFDLDLRLPEGWGAVSNLRAEAPDRFSARLATWAGLTAYPGLRLERIGAVTVAASQSDLAGVSQLARDYEAHLNGLLRFFPGNRTNGVILTLFDSPGGLSYQTSLTDGQLMVSLPREGLANIRRHPENQYLWLGEPLAAQLLSMQGVAQEPKTLQEIGRFLWNYSEFQGDAQRLISTFTGKQQPVALALSEIYLQDGEAGVVRILSGLKHSPGIPYAQAASWVRKEASR